MLLKFELSNVEDMLLSRLGTEAEAVGGQVKPKDPSKKGWQDEWPRAFDEQVGHLSEKVGELSQCAEGLAQHMSEFAAFLDVGASEGEKTATISIRFSIVGLSLICLGFAVQAFGTFLSLP